MLLVALGGSLGAVSRWALQEWLAPQSTSFPTATFLINVTGCFLIAAFAALAGAHPALDGGWRLLFPVGFVGAYTTFSTYELDLWRLIERGHAGLAAAYFVGSNALGFLAILAGLWAGRLLG
ncbi:MAG: fluoride efflux transporter CrcB [Myxococcales bacterium]